MTNELAAAVERRRKQDYLRHGDPRLHYKDAFTISDAYLAEHDPTPIDEAWLLRELGWVMDWKTAEGVTRLQTVGAFVSGDFYAFATIFKDRIEVCVSGIIGRCDVRNPTRGQLTRLVKVLKGE